MIQDTQETVFQYHNAQIRWRTQ